MRRRHRLVALLLVALAGCGSTRASSSAPPGSGASDASRTDVVPVVDVTDVATGQTVGLRTAIADDRPTLLWMWAPY